MENNKPFFENFEKKNSIYVKGKLTHLKKNSTYVYGNLNHSHTYNI